MAAQTTFNLPGRSSDAGPLPFTSAELRASSLRAANYERMLDYLEMADDCVSNAMRAHSGEGMRDAEHRIAQMNAAVDAILKAREIAQAEVTA